MLNIAAMVTNAQNLLLQNPLIDFHETWYVPSVIVCSNVRVYKVNVNDFMMTKCSKIGLRVSVLRTNGPLVSSIKIYVM